MQKSRSTKGRGALSSPPSKREASSDSKSEPESTGSNVTMTCPTCSLHIEDATELNEGQAALFCVGECQYWYHRWCAEVSQQRYLSLAESAEQFLCAACTSQQQRETTLELQGNVQALTTELLELKAIVATLQKASNHAGAGTAGACGRGNSKISSESAAVGGNKLPWNIVVSRGI